MDFAHPDLNGTQARVTFDDSPYNGWPLMLDHNSMYNWMVHGEAYPADLHGTQIPQQSIKTTIQTDYWMSRTEYFGINMSLRRISLGEHPDSTLRSKQGGDVPILVVDDMASGEYKTVYADLDRDGEFGDEVPMRPERRHQVLTPMEMACGMFQEALYTGSRMEL